MGSIQGKNFLLRISHFEPCRKHGLYHFLPECPLFSAQHPDYLHSDGAATAGHVPSLDIPDGGSGYGHRVHPAMQGKPLVLELDD